MSVTSDQIWHINISCCKKSKHLGVMYRAEKKGWYVVARYFFLALLSFSAWPCLAVA